MMGWRMELARNPEPVREIFDYRVAQEIGSVECGLDAVHDPLPEMFAADARNRVHSNIKTLRPREERIVRLLFGIGVEEQTYTQVANQLNVTDDRIRQIEAKAKRTLRGRRQLRRLF